MHTGEPLYHEDIQVGTRFVSGSYQLTQPDIVEFASRFDPQPFHTDPQAARRACSAAWPRAAGIPRPSR